MGMEACKSIYEMQKEALKKRYAVTLEEADVEEEHLQEEA